jgi:hypothetical protein
VAVDQDGLVTDGRVPQISIEPPGIKLPLKVGMSCSRGSTTPPQTVQLSRVESGRSQYL